MDKIITQLKTERDNLLSVVNERLRSTYMVLREKRNGIAVVDREKRRLSWLFHEYPTPTLYRSHEKQTAYSVSKLRQNTLLLSKRIMSWQIYVDGASSGNPGDSGAGMVIFDENGTEISRDSVFLGKMTNNMAEYEALLRALAKSSGTRRSRRGCLHRFPPCGQSGHWHLQNK